MFHDFPKIEAATAVAAVETTTLHTFVHENFEGLANAASLLAGRRGARLVAELADGLAHGPAIGRSLRNKASEIVDILSLSHVHDPERDEAAHFALIDPCDARVEEICRLTDAFRRTLEKADLDQPPVLHLRPVA